MPRTLAIGLLAFALIAVLFAASAPAFTAQTEVPTPTESSQLDNRAERSDPTEAVLLNDVNVAPVIVATGAILLVLTIVAFRREWV